MNIVIGGHVDHGKSTIIGRLLADTGSLPQGKLEQVRALCERTPRPFEYAFLLDALKDERAQGITIDSARVFFKTPKRDYIIIDAPGHIEFLKNMITGAARAEAALLVIDVKEGIQENSRRHGYMMALLCHRENRGREAGTVPTDVREWALCWLMRPILGAKMQVTLAAVQNAAFAGLVVIGAATAIGLRAAPASSCEDCLPLGCMEVGPPEDPYSCVPCDWLGAECPQNYSCDDFTGYCEPIG
jgi:Elongation factor Tu GTP binding domain